MRSRKSRIALLGALAALAAVIALPALSPERRCWERSSNVNVDSEPFPDGAIRGQLKLDQGV